MEMPNQIWTDIITKGIARVPTPLPKTAWHLLYELFGSFISLVSSNNEFQDVFDRTAKLWRNDSGLKLQYSGYFSPYYRNRTGQVGKDNKQVVQFCEPYYRYLSESAPKLLALSEYRNLVQGMMSALYSTLATYLPIAHSLAQVDRELSQALLPPGTTPSVALRLIRYESDAYYFTNPHVDKSAITVILDSDEPPDQSCLVFAPRETVVPKLSDFVPVEKNDGDAVLFLGAAPQKASHTWASPAAHAVRPLKTPATRHVAVFFWLLPGIDMSSFNTAVPYENDLGQARPALTEAA
jgi:hypothetical protein